MSHVSCVSADIWSLQREVWETGPELPTASILERLPGWVSVGPWCHPVSPALCASSAPPAPGIRPTAPHPVPAGDQNGAVARGMDSAAAALPVAALPAAHPVVL